MVIKFEQYWGGINAETKNNPVPRPVHDEISPQFIANILHVIHVVKKV